MSIITYKTPVKVRGKREIAYETKMGTVAWLTIAGNRVRFALQYDHGPDSSPALVHVASGYVVIPHNTIAARKVSHFVHHGSYGPAYSDRQAAEECLMDAVQALGATVVLDRINAAPVLN